MSITFYIAVETGEGLRSAYRCDCSVRWCAACDEASIKGEEYPEMYTCENCTDKDINMANVNAADLIRWLNLPDDGYGCGQIKATELAARCKRRLWDESRNHDDGIDGYEERSPNGASLIYGGRRPGYLRERTEQMLRLCEVAGDRWIVWG